MDNNRRVRLIYILTKLSNGTKLSTIEFSKHFNTTIRVTQLDFKEYIVPLFNDGEIYYDFSIKRYVAKTNFLLRTFLDADELATMAMLKLKSKDKYGDDALSQKTDILFEKLENALGHSIYESASLESFEANKYEIIQIKNAIKSQNEIACTYNNKPRNLQPLKILNLNSFWYLINYDLEYKEIRRYHLNSISNIEILDTEFEFDKEITEGFDNAINAYYEPHVKPFAIELYLDKKVAKYFKRKPINKTQRVLKTYEDGSCDIEVYITDFMEIIPLIQSYIPYVKVTSPSELDKLVRDNLKIFLNY